MGEKIRSYKDLRVYQLALDKAMEIFEITKIFPAEERYSLVDQARRSSRSVCTNIAEAWRKRRYKNAFIAKLSDAETEACETQVWVEFAFRCRYISKTMAGSLDAAYNKIIGQIVKMIDEADKWLIKPKVSDSPIPPFSDSKKKGFTLIEVMIAIAIIAVALVVILHSYGLGVSMANVSQDFSLATLLAQGKMAEIELEGFPEVGGEEGDFGEEYPRFTWRKRVTETPIEDLRKVTLTVSWDEKNLEVITYLAKRE